MLTNIDLEARIVNLANEKVFFVSLLSMFTWALFKSNLIVIEKSICMSM